MGTAVCRVEAHYFLQWQFTYPSPESTAASVAVCHMSWWERFVFIKLYTFTRASWVPNVYILLLFLCKNYNRNVLEWPLCPFNIRDRNSRNIVIFQLVDVSCWIFLCACVNVLLLVCKVTVFTLVLNSPCTSDSSHRISFLAANPRHFVETISIISDNLCECVCACANIHRFTGSMLELSTGILALSL